MAWRKVANTEAEKPKEVPQLPPIPSPPGFKGQKPSEEYEVVLKIPTQEIRRVQREDGTIVNYITVEEFQLMKMTQEANAWSE